MLNHSKDNLGSAECFHHLTCTEKIIEEKRLKMLFSAIHIKYINNVRHKQQIMIKIENYSLTILTLLKIKIPSSAVI